MYPDSVLVVALAGTAASCFDSGWGMHRGGCNRNGGVHAFTSTLLVELGPEELRVPLTPVVEGLPERAASADG